VYSAFTPSHRGGSGSPLVLLHGFTDTWRTWELVLPVLERDHDLQAPTLLGHAGAPPIVGDISDTLLADAVEQAMDEAGFGTADIVGNSLGGYVALQLAARGRATSVVALAPAGGWAKGDESFRETLDYQMLGVASCTAVRPLIEHALREGWSLDAERITCPVPIVWGTDDRLLAWLSAAARFRDDWLPHADWVVLDDIGHCPQLDIPLETAQLIVGFTGR
jgi:pimeloyl-ACP methyl ester carboxylesterase